jgi:hypothetical protein
VQLVGLWVGNLAAPLDTYRQAFEYHEIDGAELCELTDSKLEKIGIEQVVRSNYICIGPILAAPELSRRCF